MASWLLQTLALATYRNSLINRFLKAPVGAAIFVACYDFYKENLEVPGNHALARRIPPRTWVIDVGANIGFFSERFAGWVSEGGRVIAIEPDSENILQLRKRFSRNNLNVVDMYQAAATAKRGPVRLLTNPDHPGDHRLAGAEDKDKGQMVEGVTLDELVERSGNPQISLIKLDTQGTEGLVLDGATKTLQRCKPCLFIEIDDRALRQYGMHGSEIIKRLCGLQYDLFWLARSGQEVSITPKEAIERLAFERRGYLDLLCIPASVTACLPSGPVEVEC